MSEQLESRADLGAIECRPKPLRADESESADRARRQLIKRAFDAAETQSPPPLMFPTDAYGILFLMRPDPRVVAHVQTVFNDEVRDQRRDRRRTDAAGFIYVFRDRRDPPNIVKIGRTTQRPEERVAQWERELGEGGSTRQLVLLFALPTAVNRLAEAVIHATLYCERLPKRLSNEGRRLIEYFEIDQPLVLKALVILVLAYTDAFARQKLGPAPPPKPSKRRR